VAVTYTICEKQKIKTQTFEQFSLHITFRLAYLLIICSC